AAVVALGLLASLAAPAAGSAAGPSVAGPSAPGPSTPGPSGAVPSGTVPPGTVLATVEPGETVWEVADRVAPGLSGPQRAALAERIAAENALDSARPPAGRVLRVPAG
ncbi:MAG TPA: LysM peptidoglycan-binding domain-containing protein, partial [Pseudonocardia sp.]